MTLKKALMRARGLLPEKLPKGKEEFKTFSEKIFEAYDLPNEPGYRQAIATMILHLDPNNPRKTKKYFAKAIQKAQANEVAFQVLEDLKKEREDKQAEATANLKAVENESAQ